MTVTEFTPVASLVGGILIGVSAVLLMALEGRIAGISGIVSRLLPPYQAGVPSRLAFVAGLVAAPFAATAFSGTPVLQTVSSDVPVMVVAGLLVGFGSILGGGCTSGHGVCGLARLSVRSLIATVMFMATAIATVFTIRHIL